MQLDQIGTLCYMMHFGHTGTILKLRWGFSPLQLIDRVEVVTLVECEIPSLKIGIYLLPDTTELAEHLLQLEHLDE